MQISLKRKIVLFNNIEQIVYVGVSDICNDTSKKMRVHINVEVVFDGSVCFVDIYLLDTGSNIS